MASAGVLAITIALLVGGVVGSILPGLPGALLSVIGIFYHWWATGYTTPGTLALVTFVGLGVAAMVVDLFGGVMAASHAGASKRTVAAATAVSLVLAVFTGPLGVLIGLPATVFIIEFYRNENRGQAQHAAFITTAGIFASALMQVILTTTLLLGFLFVLFL